MDGQACIASQSLNAQAIGKTEVQPGQTFETAKSRAEVLLTPGVFLRFGHDSAVRMISRDLRHTEIALDHGHAEVQAVQIYKQNEIVIDEDQVSHEGAEEGIVRLQHQDE